MHTFIRFLHEVGHLAQIPRSGFAFLGSGQQSVAEHSYRTAFIGWFLCRQREEPTDAHRVVLLCLLHDLPEARTGDLNYVQKQYVHVDKEKVLNDMNIYPFFKEMFRPLIEEYEQNTTLEAKVAHDADRLELLLELKKLFDLGNTFTTDWMENVEKRLTTEEAKKMAKKIREEKYNAWWFSK